MSKGMRRLNSVLADREIVDELRAAAEEGRSFGARAPGATAEGLSRALESARKSVSPASGFESALSGGPADGAFEAIVLLRGRPSLLVRRGTFAVPDSATWRSRLLPAKDDLDRAIARVGRVELLGHDELDWVGTGWVVAEGVIVTNRHVAEEFVRRKAKSLVFAENLAGAKIRARVDFLAEVDSSESREVAIKDIVLVGAANGPDVALFRLASSQLVPTPIELSRAKPAAGSTVAVIGYPAYDSRNDADAQASIFGETYDVKRLAPGTIDEAKPSDWYFTHDASTLGGASGAVVLDVATGKAAGLHFGGSFRKANYAVKASFVLKALAAAKTSVPVEKTKPKKDPVHAPSHYAGRQGYLRDFLGTAAAKRVPLPALGKWAQDVPKVAGAPQSSPYELRYEHFSVVLSKSRRMTLFTAVNIDGRSLRNIPRESGAWFIDGRVSASVQTGNEAYLGNKLDRGHMVRRLDPVWGTTAELANDDTFHYSNACPQHANLNQKTWLSLEEYILDHAGARDFKVSVFTGPVLRENDAKYRSIRLPKEYWKVAVLVNEDTGKLSATGYLLSQASMLGDLEAAFVYGPFKTYQLPIVEIEKRTKLDFGALPKFDPKKGQEKVETPSGIAGATEVFGPESLVF